MKYLSFALAASLLLASCATTKPPTAAPPSDPVGADAITPDSTLAFRHVQQDGVPVARPGTFLDKVLHRTPKPWTVQPITAHQPVNIGNVPKKCKGCTFNLVAGNQTNVGKKGQALGDGASNVQTGKKSGDIIKADSGASINKATGAGSAQLTHGNNNTPTLTAPIQEAADWRATLAKPVGYALATVGTVLVVGGRIFLIAAWRRRKALEA